MTPSEMETMMYLAVEHHDTIVMWHDGTAWKIHILTGPPTFTGDDILFTRGDYEDE